MIKEIKNSFIDWLDGPFWGSDILALMFWVAWLFDKNPINSAYGLIIFAIYFLVRDLFKLVDGLRDRILINEVVRSDEAPLTES